jgi:hypothetical protein
VKHPDVGILKGYRPSGRIRKALGEYSIEIVCHFSFDLNVPGDVDRRSAAEPYEIGTGLAQLEIIDEGAHLGVILRVSDGNKSQASK